MGGSILLAASLALAALVTALPVFQFLFGIGVGAACAAIMVPIMASVTGWFDTHRSLAVSLVSAGFGMAPMTMSPLAAWLITQYDWRTSMLIIAGIVAVAMIPLSLFVRRPPALEAHAGAAAMAEAPQMSRGQALRSPQFIILALTNFFCCATHSGPIFHTVSYAVTCGIPMMAAVTIYSMEGLAGMGGRVVFGLMGDRFGAKPVLVWGLFVQAFAALGYLLARDLGGFYAVAALFGFVYAGVMPLYAVIIRENFPLRLMGLVIGGTTMAASLGMATGPLAGGLIYDRFGSYVWLYAGSWAVGTGAFLIALTFRPFAKHETEALPG
jgi:MFS family permease